MLFNRLCTALKNSTRAHRLCYGHRQTNDGGWSRLSRCNFKTPSLPPSLTSPEDEDRKTAAPALFLPPSSAMSKISPTWDGEKTCLTVFRFFVVVSFLIIGEIRMRERGEGGVRGWEGVSLRVKLFSTNRSHLPRSHLPASLTAFYNTGPRNTILISLFETIIGRFD